MQMCQRLAKSNVYVKKFVNFQIYVGSRCLFIFSIRLILCRKLYLDDFAAVIFQLVFPKILNEIVGDTRVW